MTSVSSTSSSSSTSSTNWSTNVADFDWSALVEAAVNDKLATADSIETKISDNEAKISAYEDLQSLLSDLEDAVGVLSNPDSSIIEDAFDGRTAAITANGDVTADSVVSLTLESGAALGTYNLVVDQLAQAQKVAGTVVSSTSTSLGYDGSFTIGLENGTSATITVDSDMTLSDIVKAINNQTDTTGVQASIVQISDSEYELVLSGTNTGYDIVTSSASGDDVLNELGITDSSGAFTDELQAAQNAVIELDGIQITRDSNDIDDVLDGVTIHLYQETPDDTSLTVAVETDTDTIESDIESLVTAYNSLRDYVVSQQATNSDGTASDDAVLFGDGTLRSVMSSILDALNTTVGGFSMSDLGLSFDETDYLELDTSTLESALASNLDSVKSLLQFQATTSSSSLSVVGHGMSAPSSFTLDVELDADGNISSVSVDGDSSLFTVSGTTIKGVDGTAYEGFTLVYTGSASASIDVDLSYGICDRLYDISDTAADDSTGTLQTLIDGLTDEDDKLQDKVDDIQSAADTLQETLETRYSKYAAAIAEAQSVLNYLDALLNTDSSSS